MTDKTHYLSDEYTIEMNSNSVESWPSVESLRSCPTCGSKKAFSLHRQTLILPEDHPFENEYHALVCKACSTLFADTLVTEMELADYYKSLAKYQDKIVGTGGVTSPNDRIRFQELVETLEPILPNKDVKILDIGCANGGLLQLLQEHGYRYLYGLDPSPVCVENVKQSLRIEATAGTLDQIDAFNQKFDLIVLSGVCEHLLTPKKALIQLHDFLTDNGMVYVEVPNPEMYYKYETTPFQEFNTEHINHFGLKPLISLLDGCGYSELTVGAKTIPTAKSVRYPVIFGVWQKQKIIKNPKYIFDENIVHSYLNYREICSWKLNQINDQIASNLPEKYALWGAGQFCYKLLALPALKKNPPIQVVDGNSTNWGRRINGTEIQSPEDLKRDLDSVLIANMISPEDIARRLHEIRPDLKPINLVDSLVI